MPFSYIVSQSSVSTTWLVSSSMAADAPMQLDSRRAVVVFLLLCALVPSFSCFPQKTLGKIPPWQLASKALKISKGTILFNGKELNSLSESEVSGMWEQGSQSDELLEVEAAWRLTDHSLQCGPTKMKLKVTGRGAANLELNLGSGRSLPLNQLPESCGHLLHQNSFGLVLVVSYGGCNVILENGYRVLPMIFLETSVTLVCPAFPASPPQHPVPQIPPNVDRSKRDADDASGHDQFRQYQHYHNYLKYLYYLHIINNPQLYPHVHRTLYPVYQNPDPVSRAYPYLPVHYPLYAHHRQNPAAPYCHPPGALCPLPHYYLHPRHQALPNKELLLDPTIKQKPDTFTEKPTPITTANPTFPTTTEKPFHRAMPTTTTATTTTTKRRCRPRTQSQNADFTPYAESPFAHEISYNEGTLIAGDPKSAPPAGYEAGPLLSYQYWQQEPWFSQEEDEDIPFDWDDLES
ncbi:uncharacterized protein LOC144042666 [Vanacampus margaritifer]